MDTTYEDWKCRESDDRFKNYNSINPHNTSSKFKQRTYARFTRTSYIDWKNSQGMLWLWQQWIPRHLFLRALYYCATSTTAETFSPFAFPLWLLHSIASWIKSFSFVRLCWGNISRFMVSWRFCAIVLVFFSHSLENSTNARKYIFSDSSLLLATLLRSLKYFFNGSWNASMSSFMFIQSSFFFWFFSLFV